jgi:hypothetical protein
MPNAIKSLASTGSTPFEELDLRAQRRVAVAAALEVIIARVSNSGSGSISGQLNIEMERLSEYADSIQSALAPSKT